MGDQEVVYEENSAMQNNEGDLQFEVDDSNSDPLIDEDDDELPCSSESNDI